MKRVLYICPNSKKGGAEQVLSLLIKHHDPSQWMAHVYFFSQGPLVEELTSLGASCHFRKKSNQPIPRMRKPLSILRESFEIANLIRNESIDLVHSLMGYGHMFGGIAARLCGIPEVWFQHGPTGPLDWIFGQVPSEAVLVNSAYTASQQKKYHAQAKEMISICLGVDSIPISKKETNSVTFALVGRVTHLKGHLLVVDAVALLLKRSFIKFKVKFIGDIFMPSDKQYLAELRNKIEENNLTSYFEFTGYLPNPYPEMASSDVLINSSISPEAFGLTLIEAMMIGLPIIAPREGGPKEIVEEQKTGLLFEPRNAQDLSEKMEILLQNRDLRNQFGTQGAKLAREKYTAERMTRDIEAVYRKVLRGSL